MKTFDELGLAQPILDAVLAQGYNTPTPIQAKAIPALVQGRDIVGMAQTGTGKTAAFVLPLLTKLLEDNTRPPGKTCRALIMSPTRELAAQIADSIKSYSKGTKLSFGVVCGGVKYGPQIKLLARGVDILVATPGRLMDHLKEGRVRLDFTQTVILDEADQMLDLGFVPSIRQIMRDIGTPRQTVMFSATMPPAIAKLADEFMHDAQTIAVTPASKPAEKVKQSVFYVDGPGKPNALVDLLAPYAGKRAIIFTRTKRGADRVAKRVEEAGHLTDAIHGDKSQGQRDRALNRFRQGRSHVLVATDIAARGLDISNVELVVNYELPNVAESYVHRIGRTARAGAEGAAISIVAPDERGLLRDIERLIGVSPEDLNEAPPMAASRKPKPKRRKKPQAKRPQNRANPRSDSRTEGRSKKPVEARAERFEQRPERPDRQDRQNRSKAPRGDKPARRDYEKGDGEARLTRKKRTDRGERHDRSEWAPEWNDRGERKDRKERNGRDDRDGGAKRKSHSKPKFEGERSGHRGGQGGKPKRKAQSTGGKPFRNGGKANAKGKSGKPGQRPRRAAQH